MDRPPPLIDDSSDEASLEEWAQALIAGENELCSSSDSSSTGRNNPNIGADAFLPDLVSDSGSSCGDSPCASDDEMLPPDRNFVAQAADYVLGRMRQTQTGLQAWDHADFVRMADQGSLFQPSWKPLVVFQEAQSRAFALRGLEASSVNGWLRRAAGGVVRGAKGLGVLWQLRESRIIPFRLGCNCLYDHPTFSHLFKSNSSQEMPRLMHINPCMSGPVIVFMTSTTVPYSVAFAGAEFIALGKTEIEGEDYWEVVVQLLGIVVGPSQGDEEGGDTPGLEGVPDVHSTRGTHPHSVYMAVSTEGMPTLMDGQAPADMDRFKAWHMDPEYHAVSHHLWCLEDLRIFLLVHRLVITLGPLVACFVRQMSTFWRIVCVLASLALVMWKSEYDQPLMLYYRSPAGTVVVSFLRLCIELYRGGLAAIGTADSVARVVIERAVNLPRLVLPKGVVSGVLMGLKLVGIAADFILRAIVCLYTVLVAGIVARLPPVPGSERTVCFVDAIICNLWMFGLFLLRGFFIICSMWYKAKDPSPFDKKEAQHRDLMSKSDAKSKTALSGIVREMIFEHRGEVELAEDRRRRAIAKGARKCTGERGTDPRACSAALAVAAVRQRQRNVSSAEKAAITRIIVKSGIVRDSLVRTARVVLATSDPNKAVEEVAHELMHAAQVGLTWPDECFIGRALQSEGRNPTVENVAWHRAKWVAVAARMIVDQEASPPRDQGPWFEAISESGTDGDIDLRKSDILPGERCVGCYVHAQRPGHRRTSGGSQHMKMGTTPPTPHAGDGPVACRSTVMKESRGRARRAHHVGVDTLCRELPASSRRVAAARVYPFFHLAGRQLIVEPDRALIVAQWMASIEETSARLASADRDGAKAASPRSGARSKSAQTNAFQRQEQPQAEQQTQVPSRGNQAPSTSSAEEESANRRAAELRKVEADEARRRQEQSEANAKMAEERRAAQNERKLRRAKARKERASEAEAARQQRLRDLASDMNDVLLSEKNERKDNDVAAPGSSKQGQKGNKHAKTGGAKQVNGSSRAASDWDEDEDEDEQTLCIVCMTEKRSACLVHGKTSHQIVCVPCGDRLKEAKMGCPTCKRPIDAVIHNFA